MEDQLTVPIVPHADDDGAEAIRSPMSPEVSRSSRNVSRRFARRLHGTIAILALLAGALTVANFAQGPRLASAEINLQEAVARGGQRLLLTANQSLAPVNAKQVAIEPKTGVTTTTAGSAITVQFTGILRYNTTYTVGVTGVEGTSDNARSTLTYSFTTPDIHILSLQRDKRVDSAGHKLPDTIRRTTLLGRGDGEVVFSAPRIQEYAALSSALAVVSLGNDATTSLQIVPLSGGETMQIPVPISGSVANLHAAESQHLIGYTVTSAPTAEGRRYQDTPFVYDLNDPSGIPKEVTGLDGLPLDVTDLAFVPDTASLVAQTDDQSLFLIDVLGGNTLTPLGQHAEMRGFIPGTKELIVADPTHGSTINLANGITTTLHLSESVLAGTADPGRLALLDEHGRYAQVFNWETAGATELASAITVTDHRSSDIVYKPPPDSTHISDYCVSPNGQYLAVETISAEGLPDGYPNLPASSAMTTVLIDLTTGTSTRSVSGFLPDWCR